jgi:hypothetical protein
MDHTKIKIGYIGKTQNNYFKFSIEKFTIQSILDLYNYTVDMDPIIKTIIYYDDYKDYEYYLNIKLSPNKTLFVTETFKNTNNIEGEDDNYDEYDVNNHIDDIPLYEKNIDTFDIYVPLSMIIK